MSRRAVTQRIPLAALLLGMTAAFMPGCSAPEPASSRAPATSAAPPETSVVQPASIDQLMATVRAPGARMVLLNVWATWCLPCREEFPDILRIGRAYRERGLRLVLVSGDFDTELPAIHRFLASHEVDFLTYIKQGDDMHFIDGIDPRWSGALPATALYDGGGRRIKFHEGKVSYDTLHTWIESALAAPLVPSP